MGSKISTDTKDGNQTSSLKRSIQTVLTFRGEEKKKEKENLGGKILKQKSKASKSKVYRMEKNSAPLKSTGILLNLAFRLGVCSWQLIKPGKISDFLEMLWKALASVSIQSISEYSGKYSSSCKQMI